MERIKHYLFILAALSPESARIAIKQARELNLRVTAQHGNLAIQVTATTQQAERLYQTGLFSNKTSGPVSTEHLKGINEKLLPLVRQWNRRFAASARKARLDKSKLGLSLADKNHNEPAPYSRFDPVEIIPIWIKQAQAKKLKQPSKSDLTQYGVRSKKLKAEHFLNAQNFFRKNIKDKEMAVYAGDLYARTPQLYRFYFFDILWLEVLVTILHIHLYDPVEPDCRKMHGRVSVGLVIVNSAGSNGPRFNSVQRSDITNEIKDGLAWLVSEHPSGDLVWVYDEQTVNINVADQNNIQSLDTGFDEYWRFPAMEELEFEGHSYEGSNTGIDEYRKDMRFHHGSDYAVVIFVTRFGTSWHAYSSGRRFILLSEHGDNWGGWGVNNLNYLAPHEMCHQFGARDEYTGEGTPCTSCNDTSGCDNIPNANCEDCARPAQSCVMRVNEPTICNYTRGQIGWSKIFVEIFTDNVFQGGTDDDVSLDIGHRTFNLDTENHDDREFNNREGYALWVNSDLQRSDIKRILIRKSPDGFFGGWKFFRIRVFHEGEEICSETVNTWIEGRKLWVVPCTFDNTIVNKLRLRVRTADVQWAGTDDNVTLKLAGHSWDIDSDANDFERNSSRWYNLDPKTGIHVSDLSTITIEKSSDGLFGGWKLRGLRLEVNGDTIYDNNSINKWMEGNDRTYSDAI